MSTPKAKITDLPENLLEVLKDLPRTTFSRRPPHNQAESESGVLWEVKDYDDLFNRLDQRRDKKQK